MSPTSIAGALAYDAFMGRWSRLVARAFVAWLGAPPHRRWLDIGCGTGALTAAIRDAACPASVWGVDPCEDYLAYARARLTGGHCHFLAGDGQALPGDLTGFDFVVSGLALNLLPQPPLGVRAMTRAAHLEGTVAAYVWDFAGGMQMLRYFWDAAAAIDPAASALDQAVVFPVCDPVRLRELFEEAELRSVEVQPIDIATPFRSFDAYWSPMLGGYGRVGGYLASLDANRREALRARVASSLPVAPDGTIPLTARAWAVRGKKLTGDLDDAA